jgi:hypothetical protein
MKVKYNEKLPLPARTYSEMLNKCSEGMMQINVRNNFITHFPTFLQKEQQYRILSSTGQLFTYDRTHPLEPTTLVVGNLTKVKLEKLYENNLRDKTNPLEHITMTCLFHQVKMSILW